MSELVHLTCAYCKTQWMGVQGEWCRTPGCPTNNQQFGQHASNGPDDDPESMLTAGESKEAELWRATLSRVVELETALSTVLGVVDTKGFMTQEQQLALRRARAALGG